MTTGRMSKVIQHLRGADTGLTDGQLLSCFVNRRDEAAFAALVRRHGPMVWGVCRRVLRSHHDAEDAFQATFLVLVRKAASITSRDLLGNYLYGVAQRTALKARTAAARRQARERLTAEPPERGEVSRELAPDVLPLLDEELSRLPDKYRVPIVLCDLQGKTRKEAARQLDWPEGTVAGRLARGRTLLAKRLLRRGLVLSGGAVAMLLAQAANAGMPAALIAATVKAATLFAAGKTTISGAISSNVAALTEGVLNAMLLSKVKTVLGIGFVVGLVLLGSTFGYQTLAADKAPAAAAEKKNQLRDTLLVLDNQWWEALSKNDVDTHSKILADDWVGFDAGGAHWTRARYVEVYRDIRVRDVKFLTERDVFRINENTAIMTYEVQFRAEKRDGAPAGTCHQRSMACWVQRDGGWFVKYLQCVRLPDPVPPQKVEAKPWEQEILLDPGNVVPVPPPEVKIEPTIMPGGPVQIGPGYRPPGIEILDPSKLQELVVPLTPPPPGGVNLQPSIFPLGPVKAGPPAPALEILPEPKPDVKYIPWLRRPPPAVTTWPTMVPPGVNPYPTVGPLPPDTGIEIVDSSTLYKLMMEPQPAKPAEEPKGIGKGPGKPPMEKP